MARYTNLPPCIVGRAGECSTIQVYRVQFCSMCNRSYSFVPCSLLCTMIHASVSFELIHYD